MYGCGFVAYVVFITVEITLNKTNVNGLDAAPPSDNQNPGDNLLTTILGLICGALCKNTPLTDIIPAPTDAPQYMMSMKGRLPTCGVCSLFTTVPCCFQFAALLDNNIILLFVSL